MVAQIKQRTESEVILELDTGTDTSTLGEGGEETGEWGSLHHDRRCSPDIVPVVQLAGVLYVHGGEREKWDDVGVDGSMLLKRTVKA
jgi:hypothetical protein